MITDRSTCMTGFAERSDGLEGERPEHHGAEHDMTDEAKPGWI